MQYNEFTMLPERAFQRDGPTHSRWGGMSYHGGSSPAPAPAQPTSMNNTTTSIPEYARPFVEKMLGKADALTNNDAYQQYGAERVAPANAMQNQAFSGIQGIQTAPQLGTGTTMAGTAGLGGLAAGQDYFNTASNPGAIASMMSPYQQNVTDFQKSQAVQDQARQMPGMNAAAVREGAYGGNRQALVGAEGQRNLQNTLAGIQSQGTQNAYTQAQQNLQFGSDLGMKGLNVAGQQASTLGQIGQTQYGQQQGINQAQLQAGNQQQAQTQQGLSNQYQDFLNQQNYPYKQLGFMSDMLRGMPLTSQAQQIYQAPPNATAQFAGLAGGVGSLLKGMNG